MVLLWVSAKFIFSLRPTCNIDKTLSTKLVVYDFLVTLELRVKSSFTEIIEDIFKGMTYWACIL